MPYLASVGQAVRSRCGSWVCLFGGWLVQAYGVLFAVLLFLSFVPFVLFRRGCSSLLVSVFLGVDDLLADLGPHAPPYAVARLDLFSLPSPSSAACLVCAVARGGGGTLVRPCAGARTVSTCHRHVSTLFVLV